MGGVASSRQLEQGFCGVTSRSSCDQRIWALRWNHAQDQSVHLLVVSDLPAIAPENVQSRFLSEYPTGETQREQNDGHIKDTADMR